MAKIAIMGFGTVGSGVLEVCRRNAASIARRAGEPVEVKYTSRFCQQKAPQEHEYVPSFPGQPCL